jgi:hypothetical protein
MKISLRPLPAARLPYPSITLDRIAYRPPALDSSGKRLLAVYIKPGPSTCNGYDPVPMVGQSMHHDIKIAASDQIAKVTVSSTIRVTVSLIDHPFGPIVIIRIHIANSYDLNLVFMQKTIKVSSAHRADTDSTHHKTIARSDRTGLAQHCGWNKIRKTDEAGTNF